MTIRKSKQQFRDKSLNLFKWSKQGILITCNGRTINLNDSISIDKDGTIEFLYNLLDEDLVKQQRDDVKEVIKELLEL
jgi:hypothetical protein